ncbi:hypothetical protein [Ancylobacter sp. FA202]|uniref:hypothetical protein n=1 Tax=Ancylobacter sp. FA202 TaxID=1111106 RepID=UPI00035FC4CE|nr:hypothetical protein [Ancylobacter sp. FA202]
MCGLCGAFAGSDHWTAGTGAGGSLTPTADRRARAACANEVLRLYGLRLDEWAGRFTLRSRTGRMAVVEHLGALWPEAEKLVGQPCDPLDPAVIERIERSR